VLVLRIEFAREGDLVDPEPPLASAPVSTGRLRSGAVNSSWTWNLLSFVFMALLHFLHVAYVP